jgi:cell division protein FtsQ
MQMDIKTTRKPREATSARIVPPDSSRHAHKKATNKLGKGQIAGRRLLSGLKTLGKLGAFMLMVFALLSLFVYAYSSDKFNLRTVTIHGCKASSQKVLESVVRDNFPANVLRINLSEVKSRLEKEPWVKRVEIRRILPSDLVIYVQERTPAAIVEFHDDLMITDQDGIMLDRYDPKYGKLDVPVFKGVKGEDEENYRLYQEENSERIRHGLQMLAEIESGSPQESKRISEVDISDPDNLKVLLVDDTAEVLLGEKDYQKRFSSLMENMKQYRELKNQYTEIESIDLSVEGKIIYRPRRTGTGNKSKT